MIFHVETERLLLRDIVQEDAEAMFLMDADPDVHRYLGNEPVENISRIHEIIAFIQQQYSTHGIARWAVVEKSGNQFIGWCGLKYITEPIYGSKVDYYDLGYRFNRNAWGKGFATESSKAVIQYAFDKMQLTTLFAMAEKENTASLHVLEKCGFKTIDEFVSYGTPHQFLQLHKSGFTY